MTLISDEVQFIKSSKGQPMLVDKRGYCYYKANNSSSQQSKVIWRCQKKNQKCYARATTDGFYIVKYHKEHNHFPFENVLKTELLWAATHFPVWY